MMIGSAKEQDGLYYFEDNAIFVEDWNKESCDSKEKIRQSCEQRDFVVIELGKSLIWVLGFLYIYIYICTTLCIEINKEEEFSTFILQSLFYMVSKL